MFAMPSGVAGTRMNYVLKLLTELAVEVDLGCELENWNKKKCKKIDKMLTEVDWLLSGIGGEALN